MGAERTAEKEHFDRLVDEYYKNNFGDKAGLADALRAALSAAPTLASIEAAALRRAAERFGYDHQNSTAAEDVCDWLRARSAELESR